MNFNKLFRAFKFRLLWEGILKAGIFSITTGAGAVFVASLIYHIIGQKAPTQVLIWAFGAVFLISFVLIFFLRLYPTKKAVAARIDETGLQERVGTMLEYKDGDTEILKLQRSDALMHLNRVQPRQLKSHLRKKDFLVCMISVLLTAILLMIPYDLFSVDVVATEENAEQEETVRELIEQLREEVKEAALSAELEEQLNDIIDKLEEDLQNTSSELETAAQIEQARQQLQEALEQALTKYKIGEALQKYDLTRTLGEAISAGDIDGVSAAMVELEVLLNIDNSLITTLRENVLSALTDSGVATEDALYQALDTFAADLAGVAASEDIANSLAEAITTAEAAIIAALEGQAAIESAMEALSDMMSEAKDEVLGIEPEMSEEGEQGEGEMPEGEMPDGEMPEGEMPNGEMPDGEMPEGETPDGQPPSGMGEGEEQEPTMVEGFYDPISGDVSYGEVFAAYYAEYLEALENGEVSEELQEIMDRYFEILEQ